MPSGTSGSFTTTLRITKASEEKLLLFAAWATQQEKQGGGLTNVSNINDENVSGRDLPGSQGGRAGEEERQPAPVLEEEDVRPDHGQPQHLRRHAEALQGQGA